MGQNLAANRQRYAPSYQFSWKDILHCHELRLGTRFAGSKKGRR